MLYSAIAAVFDRIEGTSSRLEMTSILSDLFGTLPPAVLRDVVYLSQGKLHPDFFPQKLGMSDKLVLRAISLTSGFSEDRTEKLWIKEGDPGTVAEMLIKEKKQMALFSEPLTVQRVMKGLLLIEETDGKDSQERKMKLLANLLHDSGPIESRYLCRIVTGRMRVGAGSMTVLDALASSFADKSGRPEIERAFNVTCDMGLVAETLAAGGMDAVRGIKVKVGNPIKVMLAERLPSLAEVMGRMEGRCAMEYKYDGIRVQAHITKDSVRLYSRRLEDLTDNFRDIASLLKESLKGTEAIVEGECVSVDAKSGKMLPFQEVTHRRRKHGMEDAIKDYPVRIFLFDILQRDGEDVTQMPYLKRREMLASAFSGTEGIQMSNMRIVSSVQEADAFFTEAVSAGCEGIMAKSVSDVSVYRAGSRGFLWIKYKKDYHSDMIDTFDLAVVGAFYGMGKRKGRYGALLMASYDPEMQSYVTVCKLGTGFDDAFLDSMPGLLDARKTDRRPNNVDSKMVPDVWFDPTVVLEVTGAELSLSPIHTAAAGVFKEDAGLGLRFPRFTGRVRDDKSPEESTSVAEIMEIYGMQKT
ncbi:MAG: ATP-dependent DNA ligase [Methanomassiliicoccaceae archaeon]|jgi:DNA ligase-1|nr:ATP-dependent DNA ligase [Methanomassiliicoccaceae archaeon]